MLLYHTELSNIFSYKKHSLRDVYLKCIHFLHSKTWSHAICNKTYVFHTFSTFPLHAFFYFSTRIFPDPKKCAKMCFFFEPKFLQKPKILRAIGTVCKPNHCIVHAGSKTISITCHSSTETVAPAETSLGPQRSSPFSEHPCCLRVGFFFFLYFLPYHAWLLIESRRCTLPGKLILPVRFCASVSIRTPGPHDDYSAARMRVPPKIASLLGRAISHISFVTFEHPFSSSATTRMVLGPQNLVPTQPFSKQGTGTQRK